MTTDVLAAHPPAVKIGGRRLSISSKPKPHAPIEPVPAKPNTPLAGDYPRPVRSDDQPTPHHEEEAPPKKEKKHGIYENEKLLRDHQRRKSEPTRPNKELLNAHKGFGGAGRIAQPAGKSFGV